MVRKYTVGNLSDIFEQVKPFAVGFDRVFDNFHNVADIKSPTYPPYNIIRTDDEEYLIEIACAGFREDEFNINLVPEGNKLIVQGVQDRGESERDYVHRGIGARNFTHAFTLAPEVEVLDAEFVDGILNITLKRIIPEEKKTRTIQVGKKSTKEFLSE